MKKRTPKAKKRPRETEWARFARGVKELKAELDKLPEDRLEQLERELKEGKEH